VVEREDVTRARETVERHLNRTPLLTSRTLGARLKCELFQRTGSFKPRGALNKIASLTDEERKRGVIAISAGNHAQAVAFAAGEYGIDALVVMWSTGSEQKREATKAYGATVDLESTNPAEAFTRLEELMAETGRTLVHPFDDPTVIAGAGTVGLEVEEDAPDADVIVVPVGGGGLVAGIKAALEDSPIQVIAVEPETSPALHDGLAAGKPVPTTTDTIADGLNAPFAGALPIEICRGMEVVLVTEQEIEEGFRFLYERAKLACEPAGAAGAAAILAGKVEAERPVVVVTGGNVAARTASGILGIR
jgi:threonine dehydratase